MCCLTTLLLVLISRLAILVWWLSDPGRFMLAFQNWLPSLMLPYWVWPLLGAIFLPWTTLAYLYVFPGGITGYEWLILVIALLIDLAGHGGGYRHRRRVWRYRRRPSY